MEQQVEKNVQAILLNTCNKKRRRRPGEIPYPACPSTSLRDIESWDHIFRKACLDNRLTLLPRHKPPSRVLDLGCGSGLWVLEAAQEWPDCHFWGYDFLKTQPECFSSLFPRDPTLPNRIKWVHGNFLEGLPFESRSFDYVRITLIGLGVPEDEWQDLLEEVHRVMLPGAILEIFEEDLIFPCLPPAEPLPLRVKRPQLRVDTTESAFSSTTSTTLSSKSSATFFSDSATHPFDIDSPETPLSKKPSLSPLLESPSDGLVSPKHSRNSDHSNENRTPQGPSSDASSLHSPVILNAPPPRFGNDMTDTGMIDESEYQNHQDHSRLNQSWGAMLSRRFISPSLVSVIPFYISTIFENIMTHPPVEIELPKNSSLRRGNTSATPPPRQSGDSEASNRSTQYFDHVKRSADKIACTISEDPTRSYPQPSGNSFPAWAPLHLAKTVRMVKQCKDAIWHEYAELFQSELPPAIVRSPITGYEFRKKSMVSATLEAFERDWKNWENDMMDRTDMRKHITEQMQWSEPITDRPDWRVWRHNMEGKGIPENEAFSKPRTSICRSMRAFCGRKAGQS